MHIYVKYYFLTFDFSRDRYCVCELSLFGELSKSVNKESFSKFYAL